MTNKETMTKQMEEYRNELKNAGENHERLMQMLNQQAVKIEQLRGAISAIERLLKDDAQEAKDGGN